MKKVLIVTTGGTIAMTEDLATGIVQPTQILSDLTMAIPSLSQYAQVEIHSFCNLPSPHITPVIMEQLATFLHELIENQAYDGFVITHGTDTLEETAYYLDLVMPATHPIVLTGAMRSSNEIGADGPLNLLNSVRIAASEDAVDKGVLVVFNDEIHTARDVTKTHTSNVATFQSPQVGPIGSLDKRHVYFRHAPMLRLSIPSRKMVEPVGLIKMATGIDDDLIQFLVEKGVKGIVIEALGIGNVPPNAVPGIEKAIQSNIPVVVVSRCFNGRVQDVYGYEGGGKHLRDLGVIFSNGLNGQKARIQLMVALGMTNDIESIRSFFA